MNRLPGIITIKAPTYKAVAEDTTATTKAAIVAVIGAVGYGIGQALTGSIAADQLQQFSQIEGMEQLATVPTGSWISLFIRGVIAALVVWAVSSWLLSFVASTLFKGRTNFGEMLRVNGFVQIFDVASAIPCVNFIAGIAKVIGAVIGVREAGEFSTGKAIGTSLIAYILAWIAGGIVSGLIGGIIP